MPGSRGYFAVAQLQTIIPDPAQNGMYLAIIEPGSYLEFPNPVPFSDNDGPVERGLLNDAGRLSGRAQAAVRPISDDDFSRIIERGLRDSEIILPRVDEVGGFEESQTPFLFEQAREKKEFLSSRAVRDRAFRRIVLRAYDERCAITGLRLINGGGRAEVDAAHYRPVEHSGPDSVQNGLALSGTAHWMLDRGLISLSDDLEIMISRQVNDRESVENFINRTGHAYPPRLENDRPHPAFLEWHRVNVFKH